MKRVYLILAALAAWTATAATPGRTATEAYVTNKIAAAVAAIPAPDFSTNNVELVETIEEAAPKPGDYETVSNKAATISLPGEDGHPGGVFVPYFAGRAREAKNASDLSHTTQDPNPGTLTLGKRGQIGDGGMTYSVWWPRFLDAWNVWHWTASEDYVDAATNGLLRTSGGTMSGSLGISNDIKFYYEALEGPAVYALTPAELGIGSYYPGYTTRLAVIDLDRVPDDETAEVAFRHEVVTPEDVTTAIREQSLGGIWDEALQVWWTPRMRNGSLTYEATTNVNLNAGN